VARRGRWTGKDWSEGHYGAIPVGRHGYASESEEVSNIRDITSNMPKGGQLSPCGDVGELGQTEAVTVFPALRKMGSKVIRSAEYIPVKEKFAK
jgi:hypothetical protein